MVLRLKKVFIFMVYQAISSSIVTIADIFLLSIGILKVLRTSKLIQIYIFSYRESVANSIIQATGTVEFEDGLRTHRSPP